MKVKLKDDSSQACVQNLTKDTQREKRNPSACFPPKLNHHAQYHR